MLRDLVETLWTYPAEIGAAAICLVCLPLVILAAWDLRKGAHRGPR
jgi:hypothetical protein